MKLKLTKECLDYSQITCLGFVLFIYLFRFIYFFLKIEI